MEILYKPAHATANGGSIDLSMSFGNQRVDQKCQLTAGMPLKDALTACLSSMAAGLNAKLGTPGAVKILDGGAGSILIQGPSPLAFTMTNWAASSTATPPIGAVRMFCPGAF